MSIGIIRCIRCWRALRTSFLIVGEYTYGPKCARMAGLVQRRRKAAEPVQRDDRTRDLFEGGR